MPDPVPQTSGATSQDVSDLLSKIFGSSNWRSEVEKTVKRNVKLLDRVKSLQAVVDKLGVKFNLETGEPKEGKLLSKDEAAAYDAFVKLGKKPDELTTILKEHGELKVKETERAEEVQYADAAEALDFENVPALTRWLKREKLVLEFKDQRVEDPDTGRKVVQKLPFVRPAGDDKAVAEPLEEYIEREVPEFVDIFKTKPVSEEERGQGGEEGEEDLADRATREAEARVRSGTGVRIPATRSAANNGGRPKDAKVLERMEQEARQSQNYSL